MKRGLSIILSLMLALLCGACQGGAREAAYTAPGLEQKRASWQEKTEPVSLSTNYFYSSGGSGEKRAAWGEDAVSRAIMDLTGVRLALPNGYQSLDQCRASGDMPDLVYLASAKEAEQMNNGDMSWAWDELAEQYCPDFWAELDGRELLANRSEDGHVYTLKNGFCSDKVYQDDSIPLPLSYAMSLRTDILSRLGADMPESVEGLESLLYQVRDRDAELGISVPLKLGDAVKNPLPVWMGLHQDIYWEEESGTIRTPWRQEAWLDYFKRLRRWQEDGILLLPETVLPWNGERFRYGADPGHPTAETGYMLLSEYSALYREAWFASGQCSTMHIGSLYAEGYHRLDGEDCFPYALIETPLTFEGTLQAQEADMGWGKAGGAQSQGGGTFIIRVCHHPERAILWMQFLHSDAGGQLTQWGLQQQHYEMNEGIMRYKRDPVNPIYEIEDIVINPDVMVETGVTLWPFVYNGWVSQSVQASAAAEGTGDADWMLREQIIRAGIKRKMYTQRNPALGQALPGYGSPTLKATYDRLEYQFLQAAQAMVSAPTEQALMEAWETLQAGLLQGGLEELEAAMTERYKNALADYQAAGYIQ